MSGIGSGELGSLGSVFLRGQDEFGEDECVRMCVSV